MVNCLACPPHFEEPPVRREYVLAAVPERELAARRAK
jgi:hypothetical protein